MLTSDPLSQHAPMQPMMEPVNVAIIPRTENAVTALIVAIITLMSSQPSTEIRNSLSELKLDVIDSSSVSTVQGYIHKLILFSKIILVYYCICYDLIGYSTRYLLLDR